MSTTTVDQPILGTHFYNTVYHSNTYDMYLNNILVSNYENKTNWRLFSELFTDDVLASNAFIFFVAGFETTASTMSYCLYELALNRDIQEELREQIKQTLNENDGKLNYDVVKDNMKYLDMVLNGENCYIHVKCKMF